MPAAAEQNDPLASMPDTLAGKPDAVTGKPKPRPDPKEFKTPSAEEIIQQQTGIHPYKGDSAAGTFVGQAALGPVRAVWGAIRSPYDLFRAATAKPTNLEEEGAYTGGGHVGLALDRMLIHPAIEAHRTGNSCVSDLP